MLNVVHEKLTGSIKILAFHDIGVTMKKWTALFILSLSPYLLAKDSVMGAGSSGGGFAIVCRADNGSILNAELLDLYEAKSKPNYELIESTGSLEGDYVASVANTYRLQGYESAVIIDSSTRKNLDSVLGLMDFLDKRQPLPNLHDLGKHLKAPAGCEIEPLAIWDDSKDRIKVSSEIWNSLSTLDQAALVQHEVVYKYHRGLYEKNSEEARAFVAAIFSKSAKPVLDERTFDLRVGSAVTTDSSSNNQIMTAFKHEMIGNTMKVYLTAIGGMPVVSLSTASFDLTGVKLERMMELNSASKSVIGARVEKVTKLRSKITTDQSSKWELELGLFPNKPVKMSFYKDGVLIIESTLNFL